MRVLISVAAGLMLVLALVGPVAATGPGCSDFGAATVDGAHNARPFGQLVSSVNHGAFGAATVDGAHNARPFGQLVSSVNHGAFAPDFNSVVELVQFEHGLYCSK